MLKSTMMRTVEYCTRYAWVTIGLSLLISIFSGYYTATR
ncbi:MAG: hypothetical protein QOD09_1313, partial [Bradyrhizobium sp.]|nr:hypothetical protein [Bradyrhizobium sp.]